MSLYVRFPSNYTKSTTKTVMLPRVAPSAVVDGEEEEIEEEAEEEGI